MRGESYVRLLVRPDTDAVKKLPAPFNPQTVSPDPSLSMAAKKYSLVVPPRPPYFEDGEVVEEEDQREQRQASNVAFSFVRHNRYEAVESVIAQDADIVAKEDVAGNTLLHVACQNNHRRIAKLLVKSSAEVNSQNANGNTPLHYCYRYNFSDLAEFLISKGADETLVNNEGLMPSGGLGSQEDKETIVQQTMKRYQGTG